MRRQTSGRETQICSYKCNIFVDKITTAATISSPPSALGKIRYFQLHLDYLVKLYVFIHYVTLFVYLLKEIK